MTAFVVDTSVVIKWFHAEGESEVAESRALLAAHRDELVTAHVLDLGIYELGNVLLRSLRWAAADVADQIDDLLVICGPPLTAAPRWYRTAAQVGAEHSLSFNGAMFVAAAQHMQASLVSADRKLLAAGLAESAGSLARRIGMIG